MQNNDVIEISEIESALSHDLGMSVQDLEPIESSYLGDHSHIFLGTYEGQKIVVKIAERAKTYETEDAGLKLFALHGIPCSEVLGFKTETSLGKGIMVQTRLAGVPLSRTEGDVEDFYEKAGGILKKINEIKLEGFGTLKVKEGVLVGESQTYKESRIAARPQFNYLMDHGFIDNTQVAKLEYLYEELINVELAEASYVHADFHPAHIFIDHDKISGVIDLSSAFAGDPRDDVAIIKFNYKDEKLAAFAKGYGNGFEDPMIEKYLTVLAARKLIYRHKNNFEKRIPSALKTLKHCLEKNRWT